MRENDETNKGQLAHNIAYKLLGDDAPLHLVNPQIEELVTLDTKQLAAMNDIESLPIAAELRQKLVARVGERIITRLEKRCLLAASVAEAKRKGLYEAAEHAMSLIDLRDVELDDLTSVKEEAGSWADVVSVRIIDHLEFEVTFADGLIGKVRILPSFLFGVFEKLKDPAFFNQIQVTNGFVTWPGELDLVPDAMYDAIKQHGEWILG